MSFDSIYANILDYCYHCTAERWSHVSTDPSSPTPQSAPRPPSSKANPICQQHSNSVSGPDFFGLGQNTIKHLARAARRYLHWIRCTSLRRRSVVYSSRCASGASSSEPSTYHILLTRHLPRTRLLARSLDLCSPSSLPTLAQLYALPRVSAHRAASRARVFVFVFASPSISPSPCRLRPRFWFCPSRPPLALFLHLHLTLLVILIPVLVPLLRDRIPFHRHSLPLPLRNTTHLSVRTGTGSQGPLSFKRRRIPSVGGLDDGSSGKAAPRAGGVGRLNSVALSKFRDADMRGHTGAGGGDTKLLTVHQNTIMTVRAYQAQGGRVSQISTSASGVDGNLIIT
ncbi:hypothetical protein K438DRAFT_1981550 [Mycena galopus ATCC 62051]|nr:hypothetical protein K438DRAFT_1981550 [Mycena galopus ATCC 62051]